MIRTNRTTRLLDIMHPSDRRVLFGVVAIIVLATAVSRLSEWHPAASGAVPVPPIILMATSYPTPSLPTAQPTIAPIVVVAPPTAEPPLSAVEGLAVPPTQEPTIAPTAAPEPIQQPTAPVQQWVPDSAPVYSPNTMIDQTEQKIQELPQEVAHPWAPDLPPPRSAGSGAQS